MDRPLGEEDSNSSNECSDHEEMVMEEERDEVGEVQEAARADTIRVNGGRVAVTIALLLTAVVVTATYWVVNRLQISM
jgi:hypothetical protein